MIGACCQTARRNARVFNAVSTADMAFLKTWIADGNSVEVRNDAGVPLLHVAVLRGEAEMVKLLIDAGAKVGATDDEHQSTPLLLAAGGGNPQITALLLAHGSDPNARNDTGATPLMLAARAGSAVSMRELLKAGASIDATDKLGRTALMYAAHEGKVRAVQLLLEKGARTDVTTPNGYSVFDAASEHQDVLSILNKKR